MLKKDRIAIAGIINNEYTRFDNTGEDDAEAKLAIKYITMNLADYIVKNNPYFNCEEFIIACLGN